MHIQDQNKINKIYRNERGMWQPGQQLLTGHYKSMESWVGTQIFPGNKKYQI